MNAREEITDMIAAVLGELEPCRHAGPNGTCHECAAVEVMELFPAVERNGQRFTLIRYGDDGATGPRLAAYAAARHRGDDTVKPRIFYSHELECWVADNGYETATFPRWGLALRFVALRWYGLAGRRWWASHR